MCANAALGCCHERVQGTVGAAAMSKIHGHTTHHGKSPTYRSWSNMRDRCLRKTNEHYATYGGRGIKICSRWDLFENFLEDMGERPKGLTLERIDSNGPYTKNNCAWVSVAQQKLNMRTSKRWFIQGIEYESVRAAAKAVGVSYNCIWKRVKNGVPGYSSVNVYPGGMNGQR